MTLADLKPSSKQLVYDLVTQAGIDTSEWADFKGDHPSTNPKFCYEWAFWDASKATVAVCLWYSQMREHEGTLFQQLNFRNLASASVHRDPSVGVRAKRAGRMDRALQLAAKNRLPVRAIVVDGVRRGEDGADASEVERRMLDPVPWAVASYDIETGDCRLERGANPLGAPPLGETVEDQANGSRKLARIAYNKAEWHHPTGSAGEQEADGTYNAQNRFGHEEWLFRREWEIGGWRYGFIQGLNNSRKKYLGQPLDITLYTIQPDGRRRLVATIYGLESLSDEQAADALAVFKREGWLKVMQDEVRAIGGNAEALGDPKWAEHVLNVRFRMKNVEFFPPASYLPEDDWIKNRHRYMLYDFERSEQERVEKSFHGRQGSTDAPVQRRMFRRGTKPLECSPEHDKMQAKLMAELQKEYGPEHVVREQDFVDVRVETEKELLFFEIKTDLDPRAVIRQALGQILEYAFHPARTGRRPDSLVIVGRSPLTEDDETYLQRLRDEFKLPLSYRVVPI